MERHFDQQLGSLRKNLIQMASLVEAAIANAVKSLIERNRELAHLVVKNDEQVDTLELELEKQCVGLLALQQPLAIDLRFITAAIKITNNLERMGDLAVNIAERVIPLNQEPQLKPLIDIPRMATITQTMVKDSIDAFVNKDTAPQTRSRLHAPAASSACIPTRHPLKSRTEAGYSVLMLVR